MNDVIAIKSESVVYLFYAVSGVSDCVHSAVLCVKLYFWSHGGSDSCLPHWSSAVQKVLLVQPSSATAERVFSMLNQSFGEQQQNALEDLVETTIMLQCNKR